MEQATEEVRFKASPELIEQLKDWSEPVQIRIWPRDDGFYEMEARNPFGITEEMRDRGKQQAAIDDLTEAGKRMLDHVRTGLKNLDALPDGMVLLCDLPGCEGHPVEALR